MGSTVENREGFSRKLGDRFSDRHPSSNGPVRSGRLTKYIGYSVSAVSLCAGIVFLTGLFLRAAVPTQLRIMFGIVFILLGVYRYFATRYKVREIERDDS